MTIKTLFLDIGGVLLTNGWGREAREAAAKKFHFDLTTMSERHRMTFDVYELGKMSLDEYLDGVLFYEKRDFTRDQFKQFMFAQSKPFPQMLALIKDLKKQQGFKIVVVSNEGRELNDYRIKTFQLNTFVDTFVSSSYVHLRKPDPEIYKLALDLSQSHPQEVLYFDDRALFVELAQQLGISSILHQDYASTLEKLKQFGIKIPPD